MLEFQGSQKSQETKNSFVCYAYFSGERTRYTRPMWEPLATYNSSNFNENEMKHKIQFSGSSLMV